MKKVRVLDGITPPSVYPCLEIIDEYTLRAVSSYLWGLWQWEVKEDSSNSRERKLLPRTVEDA